MSHPLNMDKHFEGLFRFLLDPMCGLSNADKHLEASSGCASIAIYGTRARARIRARCPAASHWEVVAGVAGVGRLRWEAAIGGNSTACNLMSFP